MSFLQIFEVMMRKKAVEKNETKSQRVAAIRFLKTFENSEYTDTFNDKKQIRDQVKRKYA